jgi:ABC-type sulfate/molybdate transport systems ATPase subunit
MIENQSVLLNAGSFSHSIPGLIIHDDDWFVITGKSGSGKNLVLETIAGIE